MVVLERAFFIANTFLLFTLFTLCTLAHFAMSLQNVCRPIGIELYIEHFNNNYYMPKLVARICSRRRKEDGVRSVKKMCLPKRPCM